MHALSASFFLQMAVILVVCRLVGLLAKKVGQPQVVGEMIAGVLLGPSLFGYFWPDAMKAVFTQESRGILYSGAQLGVGLYMFLVGLEFNTDHFRSRARSAACVSRSARACTGGGAAPGSGHRKTRLRNRAPSPRALAERRGHTSGERRL